MRQHYDLGQLLRRTYMDNSSLNLSSTYVAGQVYYRSTDRDRTLTSAYANLAGLFSDGRANVTYPGDGQPWPAQWSPVPVHTVPKEEDHVGGL